MKYILTVFGLFLVLTSCKSDKKQNIPDSKPNPTLSIAEKIANAHGFENWKNVSKIEFTFNVDRDSSHFERSWTWKPKASEVTLISGKDTITYNRKSVDSLSLNADKAFINDKYWLLAPFQLVWDKGATISEPVVEQTPMSNMSMNKITLTYPNEGGYTPGDAYDFYYTDDFLLKEWIFRKGNSEAPSLITSWENYKDFKGIKIALDHIKSEGNFKLYFTNTAVEIQ